MRLDSVGQLQALNAMMKEQFEACPAGTAMVLGAAGGNGIEHALTGKFRKVYCVDINETYLQATAERFERNPEVCCLRADLTKEADRLPRAELVIANLLIEYIGYPAFGEVIRRVCPEYVSCAIQINTDSENWVSDSPYLHVFDGLDRIHHQMEEGALTAEMKQADYEPVLRKAEALPNGKALVRLDYRKTGRREW
ncbi:MAG: methyltransferase type 11 [Clostridia bacterium]|nr:methyltransferase type 11 [Clostridia bacterium]